MLCCGRTDIGMKRKVNQDSFFCEYFDNGMMLAIVCDGMGGAAGGGIASGLACKSFVDAVSDFADDYTPAETLTRTDERLIRKVLADAVDYANKTVFERAEEELSLTGMGTTIVATLVCQRTLFTVNVGDSRMYLVKDGEATQITKDHSYVQYLVDTGKMTAEEAKRSVNRNIITRAVGTDTHVEPDIYITRLPELAEGVKQDHVCVLCSDGLTNHVSPEAIADCVKHACAVDSDRQLGTIAEILIDMANEGGGSDNITAVIVTV
ncbi:MAG: Stp1/IreP family PP2C-type Ser/Thr phosphatase [Clostridia bacterium]|nr:Stp1/IreP family PP2C-type Ser/Thr phosphatase [Clostridia bacterium]